MPGSTLGSRMHTHTHTHRHMHMHAHTRLRPRTAKARARPSACSTTTRSHPPARGNALRLPRGPARPGRAAGSRRHLGRGGPSGALHRRSGPPAARRASRPTRRPVVADWHFRRCRGRRPSASCAPRAPAPTSIAQSLSSPPSPSLSHTAPRGAPITGVRDFAVPPHRG